MYHYKYSLAIIFYVIGVNFLYWAIHYSCVTSRVGTHLPTDTQSRHFSVKRTEFDEARFEKGAFPDLREDLFIKIVLVTGLRPL